MFCFTIIPGKVRERQEIFFLFHNDTCQGEGEAGEGQEGGAGEEEEGGEGEEKRRIICCFLPLQKTKKSSKIPPPPFIKYNVTMCAPRTVTF